jgi:hypothetical protein
MREVIPGANPIPEYILTLLATAVSCMARTFFIAGAESLISIRSLRILSLLPRIRSLALSVC